MKNYTTKYKTLDYRPTLQIYDILHDLSIKILFKRAWIRRLNQKILLYSKSVLLHMKRSWLCISVLLLILMGTAHPMVSSETSHDNGFPYPGDDWAWNMIGTQYAHQLGEYGDDVVVAVMDTGIDYNHPDLKDRMWEGIGYNFVDNSNDPMDNDGHGTHVAGIVASVAPNARLMALKVMEEEGGRWVEVAQAIKFARDNGADIITMSFGGEQSPMARATQIQMNFAYQQGVLMVAAAGNDNTDRKMYPAANEQVIAVSALDRNMDKASYSNYGDWIELAAPGGDGSERIISTIPGDSYGYKMGTSMACPFVTGVAALMMGAHPGMSNLEVREALREQAIDLGEPGKDPIYGYGLVNAYRAAGGSAPTPPRELVAHGRNGTVELYWDIPWDQGLDGVEGYRIYRGTDPENIEFYVSTEELAYVDNHVVNGQRYHYHITAYSGEEESFPSDTVMAIPRETSVEPTPPRYLEGVLTPGGFRLTWTVPEDDGGEDIEGYIVYRDNISIAEMDITEYLDTEIVPGNTYTYSVKAFNSVGSSVPSESISVEVTEEHDHEEPPEGNDESVRDPMPLPSMDDEGFLIYLILMITIISGAGLLYYALKTKEERKE